MTAALVESRPMTVDDFVALDADPLLRWAELQEGHLVIVSSPTTKHMYVCGELYSQVRAQLPDNLVALYEINVDLQLVPQDQPGTVRTPDIVILTRAEVDRSMREKDLLRAGGALLAVEIVSPGSVRTDRIIKYREYADAGIPNYWIVDLMPTIALTTCRLVDGTYVSDGPRSGAIEIDRPFPMTIDLDRPL